MSLPPADRTDPRDVARSAATSSVLHEVVVAASKVLHGRGLDARDLDALRWAKALIEFATNKDVVYAMPASSQLAGSSQVAVALRRVAGGGGTESLRQLLDAVDAVLKDDREAAALEHIAQLRTLFTSVSQLALRSEVAAHAHTPWLPSPTSLPS